MVSAEIASVDQLAYDEFIRSLVQPTVIGILEMYPFSGNALIEINPNLVFAIIDRMLGGRGEFSGKVRELTDIERTVIERVIMRMLELLEDSWSTVVDVRFRYENLESNPFFVQICPGSDMVLLIILKLRVGDVEGMISICIPYFLMEPIMDKLSSQQWFASTSKKSDEDAKGILKKRLGKVYVPVALELGHTVLNVSDVMQLRAGDVIKLDETLEAPLGVRIGNLVKFRALPGSVNGRYAAEISEIIPGEDDLPHSKGGAEDD
jgi:flagellar motor switch protein FliM